MSRECDSTCIDVRMYEHADTAACIEGGDGIDGVYGWDHEPGDTVGDYEIIEVGNRIQTGDVRGNYAHAVVRRRS